MKTHGTRERHDAKSQTRQTPPQGGQGPGQGRGANAGEMKEPSAAEESRRVPEEAKKGPRQPDKAEGD